MIKEKGILAKLLEEGIKLFLKKECKQIVSIKIDIIASSIQIIKGIIQKIYIIAKDINYKDLLFDEIEIESNDIKIIFKIKNRELRFKNDFTIKFKISLSENSLRTILLSRNWNWIGDMISREISNKDKLENIKIKNNQLLITTFKGKENNNSTENFDIKIEEGKLYLENKKNNKSIKIPLEDKIKIKEVNIKNNLIILCADSPISFH